jgi:site-specific DNA-methyltransferase (adenine-specific)
MTNNDIKLENAHILYGDAISRLKDLPDNSVDSIVTDPPYGLSDNKYVADTISKWVNGERDFIPDGKGFMGKAWDSFVPPPAIWDECLRVLKPGGHLLAFFGSRTQDIGALSIRLAGFEIRDSIAWVYGSGFPKSLDISKAIDKQAGAEREVIGKSNRHGGGATPLSNQGGSGYADNGQPDITAPATDAAKQYAGWGTALKPAVEPIIVARKPLSESTVANNVLKWGTGGLNIDESRIEGKPRTTHSDGTNRFNGKDMFEGGFKPRIAEGASGRFPANIILDESAAEMLDEQSGVLTSGKLKSNREVKPHNINFNSGMPSKTWHGEANSGGASRFFYVAKASKKDRNEGLDGLPENGKVFNGKNPESAGMADGSVEDKFSTQPAQNFHPTVKPTKLMEYLVKLVTPVGGTVLDPFTGSGSTGKAALLNGYKFIGCELTEEYLPIIEGRLKFAQGEYNKKQAEDADKLFTEVV